MRPSVAFVSGTGEDEEVEVAEEFGLLSGGEDAVGQHAVRIPRAGNGVYVVSWRRGSAAREHVHAQAHLPRQARRLAADAPVAPQAQRHPAQLVLEDGAAVPRRRFLVADHLADVAHQVDHHRDVPFRDRDVEAAARVRGADTAGGQVEAEQLRVTRRGDLDPAQRVQIGVIGRREHAEQHVHVAQPRWLDPPRLFDWGIHEVDVATDFASQRIDRRGIASGVDEDFQRSVAHVDNTFPGTLLNSPLPG
jgi:hypothetical protein